MSPLDEYYLEDLVDDEQAMEDGGHLGLGEVLADALADEYADAAPEELDSALLDVMESMTPAESLNFASALRQIEKGATRTLQNPTVAKLAAAGLPIAGGAAGTVLGGPVGTALGSQLGGAAAKALSGGPALATGSTAAKQGMVLTQQPEILKALLALALGQYGRKSVAGMPVGSAMQLLSTIFGQAAADAEELQMGEGLPDYLLDAEGELLADPGSPEQRAQALYSALLDAEDEYLAESGGGR